MAKVMIVPNEDWEVVKKYINSGEFGGGIVLIPEGTLEKIREKKLIQAINDINGEESDYYNFGGDADVWVDVVLSEKHLFIKETENKIEEENEDE